jgi:hypothetical protein
MLYLDNPVGTLHGVMVYRDHANPNLFYYHSERPRISRTVQGAPEMQLIKYRRDITDNPGFDEAQAKSLGGGLFNFTVDIGLDDAVLARVTAELQRRAPGQVNLSPIPFRGGSVRLSTSKEGGEEASSSGFTFFEEVLGASSPTLVGDNRAVFSIVLSQEGATLVEQALKTGLSPVGVVYELNALAMRPAFQVKVTAEYSRVYEHFESTVGIRARVGRTATAAEIGDAYQRLVETGAIHVEVLEFTDDADLKARSQAAVDWFKGEITKEFFQTSLQPPSFAAGGSGFAELNSLFSALQNGQPNAPTTPPLSATPPAPSPAAPPPQGLASGVTPTTQANQAAQAATPGASTDFVQTALSLRHYRQEELKRREFDFRVQQAVSWNFGAQGMLSTIARGIDVGRTITVVDLDDEFFTRLRVDVSLASDLARLGVAALTVNLEYPAERPDGAPPIHQDGWMFRPGQTESQRFQCWLNATRSLAYRYQLEVAFEPDSPWQGTASGARSPWMVSSARQLTLNPLDGLGVQEVRVVSALGAESVSQAQVELRYGESPPLAEIFFVKPGEGPRTWKIRLSGPESRTVSSRVTYTLPGGGSIEGEWTKTDDGIVLVPDPFAERVRVRVFSQLVAAELVEALLVVRYADAGHSYAVEKQLAFTPAALAPQTLEFLTFRDAPRTYSWELTVVKSTGQVITRSGESAEAALVLTEQ